LVLEENDTVSASVHTGDRSSVYGESLAAHLEARHTPNPPQQGILGAGSDQHLVPQEDEDGKEVGAAEPSTSRPVSGKRGRHSLNYQVI
jgi:hypothetical protein